VSDLFSLPFEEDRASDSEPAPRRERRILTVAELTAAIRGVLETGIGDVWVEGEISNCRMWNTGHVYFTLKDDTAQIKAVMFRMAVRYLRFEPEDGLHVIARGRVGVYEPKGEYQIVCEHMEPRGLGARQLAFDQLKKRLHAEGLFDPQRKRPLPALPRRVGVVTSLEGAAIRDIVKVLRRRAPNVSLLIRPTRVQGDGAADDVARAIVAIGRVRGVDAIIVGRGGGSVEDLWTFNEEAVARAIAAAPVPVISAVGHEIDVTIADFVADVRAPTPSAAAEMVVAAKEEFCGRIDRLSSRLHAVARGSIERRRNAVHRLSSRRGLAAFPTRMTSRIRHTAELTQDLRHVVRTLVGTRAREFQDLRKRLEARDLPRRLASIRARLTNADGRISGAAHRSNHRADARFRALAGRLENLSPLAVLGRGYAVCWNADKTAIIRTADAVEPGDAVHVTLANGELSCRVEEMSNDK
jgi:exodeoxyribonuclease VII large subunit